MRKIYQIILSIIVSIFITATSVTPISAATTTTTTQNHCTNNSNHSIKCGNIGMWFGSRREVDTYFSSICNKWGTKYKNEEITWEEYTKNCPQGYECWSCSYCGKWTGNFIKE